MIILVYYEFRMAPDLWHAYGLVEFPPLAFFLQLIPWDGCLLSKLRCLLVFVGFQTLYYKFVIRLDFD